MTQPYTPIKHRDEARLAAMRELYGYRFELLNDDQKNALVQRILLEFTCRKITNSLPEALLEATYDLSDDGLLSLLIAISEQLKNEKPM